MNVGTRDHLWQARGLCPRHSWMYFCLENELRYQPLGIAVLYDDLLARATHILRAHRPARGKRHGLTPHASCFTCDYLDGPRGPSPAFTTERDLVEAAAGTRAWLRGSREVWVSRICPRCLPGLAGPDAMLCRPHLIEGGTREDSVRVTDYLESLAPRTRRCLQSMTADGPDRTLDSDAALVEAVAWFAGWRDGMRYTNRTTGPQG